jgi:VIT1/CCC1 family predicted Fe2+/Mn2+ transporter
MGKSNDGVALTAEEQRLLAGLEDRAGRDAPRLHTALTVGSRTARLRSGRAGDIAVIVLLLAGAALMIATFAIWPLVGVVGVVIQAIALWLLASRWGPLVVARVQQWSTGHHQPADPGSRPARR